MAGGSAHPKAMRRRFGGGGDSGGGESGGGGGAASSRATLIPRQLQACGPAGAFSLSAYPRRPFSWDSRLKRDAPAQGRRRCARSAPRARLADVGWRAAPVPVWSVSRTKKAQEISASWPVRAACGGYL